MRFSLLLASFCFLGNRKRCSSALRRRGRPGYGQAQPTSQTAGCCRRPQQSSQPHRFKRRPPIEACPSLIPTLVIPGTLARIVECAFAGSLSRAQQLQARRLSVVGGSLHSVRHRLCSAFYLGVDVIVGVLRFPVFPLQALQWPVRCGLEPCACHVSFVLLRSSGVPKLAQLISRHDMSSCCSVSAFHSATCHRSET